MENRDVNNDVNFDAEPTADPTVIARRAAARGGNVSPAVIKRLPRYFRYLRELIRQGKSRISSSELSEIMNVTASQIRQDLNCFGGFGQQGYGYNVNYLYTKICDILGVGCGYRAVVVGAGNLGHALVRSTMFEKRGVDVMALFDVDPTLIGTSVDELMIYDMKEFADYCRPRDITIAVLTVPKTAAAAAVETMAAAGIRGIWNFSGRELDTADSGIVVENVHMGDSLMTLCYELCRREQDGEMA